MAVVGKLPFVPYSQRHNAKLNIILHICKSCHKVEQITRELLFLHFILVPNEKPVKYTTSKFCIFVVKIQSL